MTVGSPVQSTHGTTFASTNPTLTITSTGAGNLLVLMFAEGNNTSAVTAVTDGTTGLTHYTAADNHDTFALFTDFWYLPNSNSGKTSLSVTASGLTCCWFLYEFPSAATSSPTDGAGVNIANATPANPMNGSSVTPTDAGDVVVSVVRTTIASGPTGVSAPWTGFMSDSVQSQLACAAYVIPGNTSTQKPSFSGSAASGEACSSTAAFKPAAGAAGPVGKATRILQAVNRAGRY